ncbi:aspartate kinase [Myxococcota bacterium]|nr:aspartate kinase [Myxococcota bacterium]
MLIVQKYGGTSVAGPDRIVALAGRIGELHARGDRVVVVVSAMAGETDRLLDLARRIHPRPPPREADMLLATGEQVTIALLAMALRSRGVEAISLTGGQARIVTDRSHGKARIRAVDGDRIRGELGGGRVVIVAGFQGATDDGELTTLGRGGSDTTAVALAAALGAERCEIYSDVEGVFAADPRIVPGARHIPSLVAEEMLDMASMGAKVLQTRAVEFAMRHGVRLFLGSTFVEGGRGTFVEPGDAPDPPAGRAVPRSAAPEGEPISMEEPMVRAVNLSRSEVLVVLSGVADAPALLSELFGALAEANVNVDMISHHPAGPGRADVRFTVLAGDGAEAEAVARKVAAERGGGVLVDASVAKVSATGAGMRSHPGVASRFFGALRGADVPVVLVNTSEINLSCLVPAERGEAAVRALAGAFDLTED